MPTLRSRSILVLLLAPVLLAAGCHRASSSETAAATSTKTQAAHATGAAHPAAGGPVTAKSELPTIAPATLAKMLAAKHAPMLLQVGFQKLYAQAHIPGSVYVGPGMSPAGIAALTQHVAKLPRDTAIVVYCGCCPWVHCPNVLPAYQALAKLGFTHVKVLDIPTNFGADWVSKGYPVESGS